MKNPEDQRCAICRFAGDLENEKHLLCRVRPPVMRDNFMGRFPRVEPDYWCGEFVRAEGVPVP